MNASRSALKLARLCVLLLVAPMLQTEASPRDADAPPSQIKGLDELDTRHLTSDPESLPGAKVFHQRCAQCHMGQIPKAPQLVFLQMMSGPTIRDALMSGLMKQQGKDLSSSEKDDVAEYLSGTPKGEVLSKKPLRLCGAVALRFNAASHPLPAGWGYDNDRFIDGADAGLSKSAPQRLAMAWAFEFPGGIRARSQPTIAYGAVYVGSYDGTVYALDLKSGCVRWTFKAGAEVRTAVVPYEQTNGDKSDHRLFFGDVVARMYSIDALTGKLVWSVKVDDHPNATITGTPSYGDGTIYVPISSLEVTAAADANYECCTFRGAVSALDGRTGALKWKGYAIKDVPKPVRTLGNGRHVLAPSGAPIWNSPTIDRKRGLLYVGTGENYSSPAGKTSDSIMAFRLSDGAPVWTFQAVAGDAWNVGCMIAADHPNCPVENGPDVDFGASVLLIRLDSNRSVLVAGQKNGWMYGLDPDHEGQLIWKIRLARGGIEGGIHFGLAAEGTRVYAGISDVRDEHNGRTSPDPPHPGVAAVDAKKGTLLWMTPATDVCNGRKFCDPGVSAAVTATPGLVFAGHMDGRFRVYDSKNGAVLKDFDTTQSVTTTSGAIAHGGSFSGPGAAIRDGYVVVNSGYGLYFHMPGNVLLAYHSAAPQ